MKILSGGLELVPGFLFSAIECGIRYSDRLDYCLIYSETPCNAAGMFTVNSICAAPVRLCRERVNGPVQAILINSTNANACTGDKGYGNSILLTGDIAVRLGIPEESVLMASTGIVGRQLPADTMLAGHGPLVLGLSAHGGALIPRAIMTTDTVPKFECISFQTSLGERRIAGTAKGSGMIAPDMATLLCFIITDASVDRETLHRTFRNAVGKTLNSITIDGDMSTNDTALILSPDSGRPLEEPGDISSFEEALAALLMHLAEKLVSDGEGTTKVVTVRVIHAVDDEDAKKISKSVSESLLVKTALFGNDPNWGRIAVAAGYSGARVDESSLTILFDDLVLLDRGTPVPFDKETIMPIVQKKAFTITVDIGLGDSGATMLTTDLSYDYVKINAEYST
ncbi:MAG: bifunctional glutamate N-acetyltransferase/amino-acid acetyltransferase ArgJ [Spirochaetes bacterium]|nr:bifunctional glutamate N-acetyltransferase/amino-acid acetyltransferase ArgJ [Spirochaetota bacterium]